MPIPPSPHAPASTPDATPQQPAASDDRSESRIGGSTVFFDNVPLRADDGETAARPRRPRSSEPEPAPEDDEHIAAPLWGYDQPVSLHGTIELSSSRGRGVRPEPDDADAKKRRFRRRRD